MPLSLRNTDISPGNQQLYTVFLPRLPYLQWVSLQLANCYPTRKGRFYEEFQVAIPRLLDDTWQQKHA